MDSKLAMFILFLDTSGASLSADAVFKTDVWPIFEARCVECHRKPYLEEGKLKQPKAGLRLDGAWHIMKGSDDGPIVVSERMDASTLYHHISLPADDDDIMPPKGEPLSKEQIQTIGQWIEEGARFDDWEGATDGVIKEHEKVYAEPTFVKDFKKLEPGLSLLPDKVLEEVAGKSGASVRRLHPKSPLVDVGFFTTPNEMGDSAVKALAPIRNHVTKLAMARMDITDASMAEVAKFPQLSYLSLKDTKVTDAGVKELAGLQNLVSLNLYGTGVTDEGVAALGKCKSLKKLYLARTQASAAGIRKLQTAIPGLDVSRGL
jgi:hypothetical protein